MTVKARVERLEAQRGAATPDLAELALQHMMLGSRASANGPEPSDDDLVRHGTALALRVLNARRRTQTSVQPATLAWPSPKRRELAPCK